MKANLEGWMMKNKKRVAIKEPDDFDILSATWILANTDENEMMSYQGIKCRLKLEEDYDLQLLIHSRGDLFRQGVPTFRLQKWKTAMLAEKHLPLWLKEIEDEAERNQVIERITENDIFRSQFRTRRDSPQSSLEIINWGLEHIERLRKASIEAKAQSAKRWEIWLVFGISILNLAVTLIK
jgi:hypothetical protein